MKLLGLNRIDCLRVRKNTDGGEGIRHSLHLGRRRGGATQEGTRLSHGCSKSKKMRTETPAPAS